MQNRKKFTVLSLLEPNRIRPAIIRLKPASRFHRRKAGLSDRLLAGTIQWSLGSPGAFRKNLTHVSL